MQYLNNDKANHVIFTNAVPEYFYSNPIGQGANGKCYLLDSGEVYKEARLRKDIFKDVETLSKIKSDYYYFPKQLVFIDEYGPDYLKGYKMDYSKGMPIIDIDKKTDILKLFKAIEDLQNETVRLSEEETLRLYDFHNTGNVLYVPEDNKIEVIDTDLYYFDCNCEPEYMYRHNYIEIAKFFIYQFMGYYNFKNERLFNDCSMLCERGKLNPIFVLREILEEIQKDTKQDVNTLEEFQKGAKLIMKN